MLGSSVFNRLKNSGGFLKYLKNTSWLAGEKLATMGISFAVGVLVARYLGPSNLGILSYAGSIAAFFAIFSELGLTPIITRNLVKNPEKETEILGTALLARIGASVLNVLVLLIAFLFIKDDPLTKILTFMFVASTIFQSFFVIDYFYQSRVESKNAVQVRLVQFVVSTILKVCFLVFNAHIIWFALGVVLNDVMNATGLIMSYQRKNGDIRKWNFNKDYFIEMMKDSFPIFISGFLVLIYTSIDQIMIKHLMGNAAVGLYSVGTKLSEMSYMVPSIIVPSLFPAIVKARNTDHELFTKRMQTLFDFMMVIALVVALGVTILGPWFIRTFYGATFEESGVVFQVHIWTCVFVYLGLTSSAWVFSENLQIVKLTRSILGAVVNVVLNYFWIPRYGIIGAAVATLVSQIVASYLGYLFSKKTWPLFVMMSRSLLLISPFQLLMKVIRGEKIEM